MAKIKSICSKDFENDFKKTIESCNINLLIGAGFSKGIVDTLGNTEILMEAVNQYNKNNKYAVLEAYLFWDFFKRTIYPLYENVNEGKLKNQISFVKKWKKVLADRESAVINKQANFFTSNYDIVLEYSLESTYTDYNDGFKGKISPYFSTTNFNRLYYERALFSNRSIEIPIFNLFKLHGSVSWKIEEGDDRRIIYNDYRNDIKTFYDTYREFFHVHNKSIFLTIKKNIECLNLDDKITGQNLDDILPGNVESIKSDALKFTREYKKCFKIVNPTKEKFSDTLIDKNYYELMRIYCNELERTNTLLVVIGFSFSDEHFEEMTKRALGNPSLTIVIFSYCKEDLDRYERIFKRNDNVWIIIAPDPTDEEIADGITEIFLSIALYNECMGKLFGEE